MFCESRVHATSNTSRFIDALPSVFWMSAAALIFLYMLAVALTSLVGGDTDAQKHVSKPALFSCCPDCYPNANFVKLLSCPI